MGSGDMVLKQHGLGLCSGLVALILLVSVGPSAGQPQIAPPAPPNADQTRFISAPAGRWALAHATLIDGTGAPAKADQTVLIDGARILAVQAGTAPVPPGYRVMDLTGRAILPGLVGMHDHLYYIARPDLQADLRSEPPLIVPQMSFSAPRLYLAEGVTTLRTTGSVEPFSDLNLKREIDAGRMAGPHLDVTGPYLEGENSPFIQMDRLHSAQEAQAAVAYWAQRGATSFKAYMNITRAELGAAIAEAHRRGLKITGHLCSVTYKEAADLGIDDLEHGFMVDTADDPGKIPDVCPRSAGEPTLRGRAADSPEAQDLIKLLVTRHVAVTSTLPVFETANGHPRPLSQKALDALAPASREDYYALRLRAVSSLPEARAARAKAYENGVALERAFVAAGGLLLAGPDPTGAGDVIPGFGDLRALELLVEGGFAPVDAIRIGTLNGAIYLDLQDRIGSIAPGKDADLLIVKGDPSKRIEDLENTEVVFKDGVGYDPNALLATVRGTYGRY